MPDPTDRTERTERTRRLAVILTAVALAAAGIALLPGRSPAAANAAAAAAAARQQAGGVAVVDVPAVINESAAGKALEEQGRARAGEIQAELERIAAEIQRKQEDQTQVLPESDEYAELGRDIRNLAVERQVRGQAGQQELAQFNQQSVIRLYRRIEQAVQAVAQERGLAVVIRKNAQPLPEDLSQVDPQQLGALLATQTTLYTDPGSDITGEVTAKLDEIMGNGGQGEAAPAAQAAPAAEGGQDD